jgi:hypothetical protein
LSHSRLINVNSIALLEQCDWNYLCVLKRCRQHVDNGMKFFLLKSVSRLEIFINKAQRTPLHPAPPIMLWRTWLDNFIITHRFMIFWYEVNGHNRNEVLSTEILQDILKSGLNLLNGDLVYIQVVENGMGTPRIMRWKTWLRGTKISNCCYEVNGFDSADASTTAS